VRTLQRLSFALLLCGLPSLGAATGIARDIAKQAYKQGQLAERAGDHLKAYLFYAQAAQADPKNPRYAAKQNGLRQSGPLQPRAAAIERDPADETLPAQLEAAGLLLDEAPLLPETAPPPRLITSPEKHDFAFKGNARDVLDKVAAMCGIQLLYDPTYTELPTVSLSLAGADGRDALRAVEAVTDSFLVPLDSHTALVARDTQQNRTQWTRVISLGVPIPERLNVQEAQELAATVQQTLEIRRISMDPTRHAVYFRDAASKAFAGKQMFEMLSRARAQVSVDVQVLSISKSSPLAYGLSLPTSASIVDFGTLPSSLKASTPDATTGFTPVGGGASLIGIGVGNAAAIATLGNAASSTVLDSNVISLDGQAATFKVGERYPVTTASYSAVNGSAATTTGFTPTINYIDLGLSLKITPTVHDGGEVTLDVEAEFKSIGAGVTNGIPAINNQQYQGKVRLKDGEWAVVAGMVQLTNSDATTGVAGLSRIPLLGRLFRSKTRQQDHNEILIVLKPRLLNDPTLQRVFAGPIWTGTETRPITVF
jgi:general secretion pathway protein D